MVAVGYSTTTLRKLMKTRFLEWLKMLCSVVFLILQFFSNHHQSYITKKSTILATTSTSILVFDDLSDIIV